MAAGDKHVFYAFGKDFYSNDTYAVDVDSPTAAGCHPTDVGHYRIARHYSAILPGWMAGDTNGDNARAVRAEHEAYLAGKAANKKARVEQRHRRHPLNCEPLPAQCPGQEGKNASCFACAKAHASALAKAPGCTAELISDWCLMVMPAPPTTIWSKAEALGPIRGIPSFPPSLPMGSPFHRFPLAAQKDLTSEMWEMSTWGSGTFVRFDSNASSFAINFTLTVPYEEYEYLMPIDGTSGLDLYARDTKRSAWLFVGNCLGAFEASHGNQTVVCHLGSARDGNNTVFNRADPLQVHYLLYLPLYNGVSQLSIGHSNADGGVLTPGTGTALDKEQPPVVWFGTSITQGGAASRPGAQFINGISRSLGRPIINWGFAGPGQMDLSVAKCEWLLPPPFSSGPLPAGYSASPACCPPRFDSDHALNCSQTSCRSSHPRQRWLSIACRTCTPRW